MSLTVSRYPEYRDTDIPWLGSVPAHWELVKTKYLFRERSEKGFPNEPLLAATQTKGVVRKEQYENRTVLALKDLHLLKLVRAGDFVISLRSFQGGIEYAHHQGIISPAYTILEPRPRSHPEFFASLLKSRPYVDNLSLYVTCNRQGQNIDYEKLGRSLLPAPPAEEQVQIARFCASLNQRINRLIRAKRSLIALLNEQKQAIIHRAVTCGLNPNVPLKPTGVDSLPSIPEDWEIGALRRFWEVVDCKHLTVPFVDEGVPLASVREVQSFDLDLSQAKMTDEEWYQHLTAGRRKPQLGDLIYCRNVSVGACAYVGVTVEFAMGQDVCLIRSRTHNQRYLNYFLHSAFMDEQLARLLVGSTFKRINISQIRALTVLLTPRLEQDAITVELDQRLQRFGAAVGSARREIELLREYRTRLITDVVTGKLDVRGVDLPPLEDPADLDALSLEADPDAEDELPEPGEETEADE